MSAAEFAGWFPEGITTVIDTILRGLLLGVVGGFVQLMLAAVRPR